MAEPATTKIYIVQGTTGEYCDRSEWNVCAYFDKEMATAHATSAQLEAKRIEATTERYVHKVDEAAKIWDRYMCIDYTGTDYQVVAVDIRAELPKVKA